MLTAKSITIYRIQQMNRLIHAKILELEGDAQISKDIYASLLKLGSHKKSTFESYIDRMHEILKKANKNAKSWTPTQGSLAANSNPTLAIDEVTYGPSEQKLQEDQALDWLIKQKKTPAIWKALKEKASGTVIKAYLEPVSVVWYLIDVLESSDYRNAVLESLSGNEKVQFREFLKLVDSAKHENSGTPDLTQGQEMGATRSPPQMQQPVDADPVEADPVEADPVKVSDEYRQSRVALLNYVKCVIEKDAIAVDTIAAHYHMRQPHDASTVDEIAEKLFPSSEKDEKARQAPKAFEEILKLAKSCKERMKEFQIETIRSIRNVAICLSFPHELCKQACKDKLEYRPIRIPTGDIEWVKLFIGRVLVTIARSDSGQSNTDRSILERLTSDRESMIEIPIESLLPKSSEMVHPPRDSGASSVHFLADLCMGIAKHLLVESNCNKEELEKFFRRWNGESSEIQCDSIETLQSQFDIWKILEGHLLLMVSGKHPQPVYGKIRKLFDSVQVLQLPAGEHRDVINLRLQIRYFDDMTNQDKPQ